MGQALDLEGLEVSASSLLDARHHGRSQIL